MGVQENLSFDVHAFNVARVTKFRSVAALARAVRIEDSQVRRIALGLVPSPERRERIARALGVPAETLWKPIPVAQVSGEGVAA